jgi:phosphoribosylamine---glycine ligase
VVKTDGLAAGKGVFVTDRSFDEAEADVRAKLSGTAFGDAGRRVVIEEYLDGPELSVCRVCDGQRAVALGAGAGLQAGGRRRRRPQHRRHGRLLARCRPADDDVVDECSTGRPARRSPSSAAGASTTAVFYAGSCSPLEGPKLVEYNVRFGDPEAQVVLPGRRRPRRRAAPWPGGRRPRAG